MQHLNASAIRIALACLTFSACLTPGFAQTSPPQFCKAEGAFGIRFGDKTTSTRRAAHPVFFGLGCYQVTPPEPHPFFDTYAACVSEFNGKIFMIQALRVFDDKPPQGSQSLTPAQRESNRQRGQQVLDGLLTQIPAEARAKANVDDAVRTWGLPVDKDTWLEVSNYVEWAVTLECRNEPMRQEVFQQRLQRSR